MEAIVALNIEPLIGVAIFRLFTISDFDKDPGLPCASIYHYRRKRLVPVPRRDGEAVGFRPPAENIIAAR